MHRALWREPGPGPGLLLQRGGRPDARPRGIPQPPALPRPGSAGFPTWRSGSERSSTDRNRSLPSRRGSTLASRRTCSCTLPGGNYDTEILVSGDTDFADAVQAVKDFGRKAEVALFGTPNSSRRLRDVADSVISLAPPYFEALWLGQ
ncbi:MAG: NYN domain-containing protein [Chloroflexi bacterium]|nr:NYN domain-containing protein [Chloroflexota bacterium]